jgi:hypothetical protein
MEKLVVQFDNVNSGLEANKPYFAVTSKDNTIIVYKDDMTPVTVDPSKLTTNTSDTSDTTSTDVKSYKILWSESTTSGGKAKSKRNRRNQKKQKKSRRN